MRCDVEPVMRMLVAAEGLNTWLYRDERGLVRVGAGLRIDDDGAAAKLPFQVGARAATQVEIAREFLRVKILPAGLAAGFYRGENSPELEPSVADALVRTSLVGLEFELRERVGGFDGLKQETRTAVLEMAYRHDVGEAVRCVPGLVRRGEGAVRTREGGRGTLRDIAYGLVGAGSALLRNLRG